VRRGSDHLAADLVQDGVDHGISALPVEAVRGEGHSGAVGQGLAADRDGSAGYEPAVQDSEAPPGGRQVVRPLVGVKRWVAVDQPALEHRVVVAQLGEADLLQAIAGEQRAAAVHRALVLVEELPEQVHFVLPSAAWLGRQLARASA